MLLLRSPQSEIPHGLLNFLLRAEILVILFLWNRKHYVRLLLLLRLYLCGFVCIMFFTSLIQRHLLTSVHLYKNLFLDYQLRANTMHPI
jgi:hypothetical protein